MYFEKNLFDCFSLLGMMLTLPTQCMWAFHFTPQDKLGIWVPKKTKIFLRTFCNVTNGQHLEDTAKNANRLKEKEQIIH
jgi:hypothetical protein